MTVPFFRTPYNYDRDAVSDETGLRCEDESLAQQSFKDECDINVIVKRFGLTGTMPESVQTPVYADFTDLVTDYHSAMDLVLRADEAFMSLPAAVRVTFNNDAGAFVDFCSDAKNAEKMRELGLTNVPLVDKIAAPVVSPESSEKSDGKV